MRTSVWGGLALAAFVAVADPAHSIVYGGGGGPSVDCLAVFEGNVNEPPGRPRKMRCTDGAACDEDGLVNGVCAFDVSVCANSTFDPGRCNLAGVDEIVVAHALDNGDPKFDPDFQALQGRIDNEIETPTSDLDVCTTAATIRVPIRGPFGNGGCKKASKLIKLTTESRILQGKSYRDNDKLTLICDPPPNCEPRVLFTGGTFERIQRQVFNPSCGVSSCHDSESNSANLILEEGTAYGQIVNLNPTNGTAGGMGWKRVDAVNASPDTSFLFHKVTGDLGPGLGSRMPLRRGKLPRYLIDLFELWILAGAPSSGWVPGTD